MAAYLYTFYLQNFILLLFNIIYICNGQSDYLNTYNWKFHFPSGSSMGIFFAIAFPLDIPDKSVFLSYNFEAVYSVPGNETREDYPPLVDRSEGKSLDDINKNGTFKGIDRKLVYDAIEMKMTRLGYPGKSCLLRTICETALMPVKETNGVLGDIFHIIFTPSSSKNVGLTDVYQEAEYKGKYFDDCSAYHQNCSTSFLDLVSWIDTIDSN